MKDLIIEVLGEYVPNGTGIEGIDFAWIFGAIGLLLIVWSLFRFLGGISK